MPRSPFVACVVHLWESGVSLDDARWAAGQATQRLTDDTPAAEVISLAQSILATPIAA